MTKHLLCSLATFSIPFPFVLVVCCRLFHTYFVYLVSVLDANPILETEEQKEHIRQEFVTSCTSASQPLKDKDENVGVLGVSDPPKSESAEVKGGNFNVK